MELSDQALAEAMRAARHAANNLLLAAAGNLELLRGPAAADPRQNARITRAEESLARLRALLAAEGALFGPPCRVVEPPRQVVAGLLPLLAAIGRGHPPPVIAGEAPDQPIDRPVFERALLAAAMAALSAGPLTLELQPEGVLVGRALVPYRPALSPSCGTEASR